MSRVLIVTDSNAFVPPLFDEGDGVRFLPISIHFAGEEVDDHSIAPDRVVETLARHESVKSSPPSVLDYLGAIEDGNYDEAVVLTPATEFTAMYEHAVQASLLSTRPAHVVDTRTAAAAQALVVAEAVGAARRGAPGADVAEVARAASQRVDLVGALDSIAVLEESGRVPSVALEPVSTTGNRGLFRLRDGTVAAVMARPGPGSAHGQLVDVWERGGGRDAVRSIVFHAGAASAAGRLRAELGCREPVVGFSPAMVIHTGPGVVGVAWLLPA